jgi:2-oxoglutarate dehydrogenase E1 component
MLSRPVRVLRRFPNVALRSTSKGVRSLATATPAKDPSPNDPFANGTNTYYAEEMYRLWRQDPKSVHVSWDVYFTGMDKKGLSSPQAFQPPPDVDILPAGGTPSLHDVGRGELDDHLKVCVILGSRSQAGGVSTISVYHRACWIFS